MKLKETIFYVSVLVVSVLFLFVGNRVASGEMDAIYDMYEPSFYTGVVIQINDKVEIDDGWGFIGTTIYFDARITGSGRRGDIVTARQHMSNFSMYDNEKAIEVGDRIVLVFDSFNEYFFFVNFARINIIVIFGVAFLVLVVIFGRMKGFNAIVALGFTCMSIFMVFIPAILSGRNIYMTVLVICCYSVVSALLIVIGPNKKALSAILGCVGGIFLAGILMFVMDILLGLTGVVDQEARMLLFLPTQNPINLRAIIFAGVIIGAVGAVMDVAMSIASSLWEIKEVGGASDFGGIFKAGINIGKDILGTQLNTLILAYIGSSLSVILLITVHSTSHIDLFNMEMIIVEFLRALIGSFGMFMTIPITAGICAWFYSTHSE